MKQTFLTKILEISAFTKAVEYKRGVLVVMFDWKDLLATMIGGIIPALIKIFIL